MAQAEGMHKRMAGWNHRTDAGRQGRSAGRGIDGLTRPTGLRRHNHAHATSHGICGVPALGDLRAMAVEFPIVHNHPNRLPFEGVLTLLDEPSDKAPSGARGHRVVLTRQAAEAALPSLLGMAVDYKAGWDGHDARQKCGIITAAEVDGRKLTVAGYLFARDFPEFGPAMENGMQANGALGMSYELADAHVTDMRAPIWTLTPRHLHRSRNPAPRKGRLPQHQLPHPPREYWLVRQSKACDGSLARIGRCRLPCARSAGLLCATLSYALSSRPKQRTALSSVS